jgi:iron complex outermembrane recepter protein
MYGGSLTALLMAMGIAAPGIASAADATADATATADASGAASASSVSEVIVTGTRQTGVTAANSAAPVQVVGSTALLKTGAIDLATSLTSAVPSLNIQTAGGDMAALSIQAALRGLSPNDTLVLVDGKRRHDTANLAVDGDSAYSGSATVDLSFIPVAAIDHVEVLTDGAAAQYGTDAIAGVVNVILKKSATGGGFDGTGGSYYSGQGLTGAWSLNKGFGLGDNAWLNVTLEERYHDWSSAGIGDFRFQSPNGAVLPGLPFPNSNVTQATDFPHENKVNGDPQFNLYNFVYNFGWDFGDGLELYSYGTAGYRLAAHFENYRSPSKVCGEFGVDHSSGCPTGLAPSAYPLPLGFDPQEQIKELDGSFTVGLKGKVMEWDFDLATSYGDDYVGVYVINSANAQLFPLLQQNSPTLVAPQRNFYNGAFESTQSTTTLDFDRGFDVGLASPLNVAFGGEARFETFSITAGEPSSYFGAGAQSFDGYTPLDQGSHSRSNYAAYIDVAVDPIENLHLDLAGRYETYSDFGDAVVGKGTARYDFNPTFAVRGTISTGFRAPTLAEEFYSGTNVSPTSADVQLPPNSSAAALAGFSPLKPEESTNYSVGFVAHPTDHMQITLDGYDIELKNRIGVTGLLFGSFQGTTVSQGVLDAIAARGVTIDTGLSYVGMSVFTNTSSTRTYGIELTANYASDFDTYGHVDWTVGFNFNKTDVKSIGTLPDVVTTAPTPAAQALANSLGQGIGTPVLGPTALSALTKSTPEEKAILQAYWTLDKWSVNLRGTIYGPAELDQILNSTQQLFVEQIPVTGIVDLDVGYKIRDNLKIDIGANNLFNTLPPRAPTIAGQPADNGLVYNVPYTFSPYGINGGYYYGRISVTF